jgi:hypothetical protein
VVDRLELVRVMIRTILMATALLILDAAPIWACAVCFSDPEAPMAHGVVAGVLVLGGIVGFVLIGILGTAMFWVHRSRRLRGAAGVSPRDVTSPAEPAESGKTDRIGGRRSSETR